MPVTPTPPENFSMGRPACSGTTAHEAESGSLPAFHDACGTPHARPVAKRHGAFGSTPR